jgi:hypothetical protein
VVAVGHGAVEDLADVVLRQALQFEDPAAADEGAGEREEGVLRGGTDQGDHAVLDVGQEDVLLRLVEAVDLVDEQAGPLAVVLEPSPRGLQHVPHVLDARRGRRELHEPPLRFMSDDLRQRGLAHAGRPVEHHRSQPIGLDQPPQEHALPHHLPLAHVVGQPPRTHAGRERRGPGDVGGS